MDKKIGFFGGKFLPLHMGHIYSILYSASRCDELHVFLFINDKDEEEMIKYSHFPKDLLQGNIRELILKYEFENYDNIKLHTIDCSKSFKNVNNEGWDYSSNAVLDIAGCVPNIIFSSDPDKKKHFEILYPFAEFSLIDPDRSLFNISSTMLRNDGPYKHWNYLTKSYRSLCAKSIVVIGDKIYRERLINDLSKLFNTSYIDNILVDQDEIKKKILEARFNSDKIFFINAVDENNDKYIQFYNIHNYRFSINFTDEDVKKYNSINLLGDYDKILKQGILRCKNIINN